MTAVGLDAISVTLGGARVVDRVSASVDHGEWVTVIGPNGAGKSTLLRAVAGLVAYEGRVELLGDDARRLTRREHARRVAVVAQAPTMPADATVREYVLLGRTPHIGYLASEGRSDHEAVERAIDRLDLGSLAERRLSSLSGGERQRAVLARALAQQAPLLLLDEPTTALDVGRQQQALEIVDELRADAELTVLSAMHDLTLAGQYADRLLLLDRGRLVAAGSAADVLTRALIAEHYRADVRVVGEPETGLVVVPVRRSS
ncbi:MAG TPA: ABC transporter ATP-binding protein [Gaiellaceae bacterium]